MTLNMPHDQESPCGKPPDAANRNHPVNENPGPLQAATIEGDGDGVPLRAGSPWHIAPQLVVTGKYSNRARPVNTCSSHLTLTNQTGVSKLTLQTNPMVCPYRPLQAFQGTPSSAAR